MNRILLLFTSLLLFFSGGGRVFSEELDDRNLQGKVEVAIYYFDASSDRNSYLIWDSPVFASYSGGRSVWSQDFKRSLDTLYVTKNENCDDLIKSIRMLVEKFKGKRIVFSDSNHADQTIVWSNGECVLLEGNWLLADPAIAVKMYGELKIDDLQPLELSRDSLDIEISAVLKRVKQFDTLSKFSWLPPVASIVLQPPMRNLKYYVDWPSGWPHVEKPFFGSKTFTEVEFSGSLMTQLLTFFQDSSGPKPVRFNGRLRYAQLRVFLPGTEWQFFYGQYYNLPVH